MEYEEILFFSICTNNTDYAHGCFAAVIFQYTPAGDLYNIYFVDQWTAKMLPPSE